MAKGRANLAPIRFLSKNEAESLASIIDLNALNDYYLTQIVSASNIHPGDLAETDPQKAYAGIFVANVFMHKWDQHFGNMAFAGDIPVSVDNDETFSMLWMKDPVAAYAYFLSHFLEHAVIRAFQ